MSPDGAHDHKRFKWEPAALLVVVVGLGIWLVAATRDHVQREPGHAYASIRLGPARGILDAAPADENGHSQYRLVLRDGHSSRWYTRDEMTELIGEDYVHDLEVQKDNLWFRLFNISSWGNLGWVLFGFGAQTVFMGRMVIQWVVSEKRRESVVPASFWYVSFLGGVMLFTYFVWRQDIVGVLGQSTGVVIYARNIRLIHKSRRRSSRTLTAETADDRRA